MSRNVELLRACNWCTTFLICLLVVLGPWLFGSTMTWAIKTSVLIGYLLGILLACKTLIRWSNGIPVSRWIPQNRVERVCLFSHLALVVLILGYCFVSAWNARMSVSGDLVSRAAVYLDCIGWLPHSYDQSATWFSFEAYFSLWIIFVACWDWLSERSSEESSEGVVVPRRLKILLWALVLNGFLLSLEGILQRMSGTGKLLWMVTPHINRSSDSQFGPFAYRGNGAQYINLVWPAGLGLWWLLRDEAKRLGFSQARSGGEIHWFVLLCTVVTACAPFVTTSRGGIIVTLLMMLSFAAILIVKQRFRRFSFKLPIVFVFVIASGLFLGWPQLRQRMGWDSTLSGRTVLYENGKRMLEDYQWFGSGPGSFATVYEHYKGDSKDAVWAAYLHDDWMQTLIEWGILGFVPILILLFFHVGIGLIRPRGVLPGVVTAFLTLACVGCLIHGKFDFPFQVHSILVVFVLICSILFAFSGRVSVSARE